MGQDREYFDVDEICNRINVHKPYFAFQELWRENDSIVGSFIPEQPMLDEIGAVTTGEIGRHLAILGSCAGVILQNSPDGYYLAMKGHMKRNKHSPCPPDEKLFAGAQIISINDRSLTVAARIWGKEQIAELTCVYAVVPEKFFKQKFKDYANEDLSIPESSPYKQPVEFRQLKLEDDTLEISVGPLEPQQCSGHFQSYPCWPVAIISQTAFQAASELIKNKYGADTRYEVHDFQLSAEKLVSSDSILTLHIQIESVPGETGLVSNKVIVYHGDDVVANLKSILELDGCSK